ncbi:MAG: NAD-dependent epimerase/dehydratase family protein [Chitinophagaceae bacterium]
MNSNKILIIGSQGFIGSAICNYFLKKGFDVVGCDIVDKSENCSYYYHKITSDLSNDLVKIFAEHQFQLCINAAGSGNVPLSVENPLLDFKANVADVISILDAIKLHNSSCKYLHISSAAVYGNPEKLPVCENDLTQPVSPYGYHKLMSESICKEYYKLFGLKTAIIRPFSVYGAGLKKQLFWDLCQKISKSESNKIELFGTGEESRDFIYINDLVELIYLINAKDNFECSIYNAASGIETKINQLASIIQPFFPTKKIAFSGQSRIGDPNNWVADISKSKSIGFANKVAIETGIEKYIEWFKHLQ